MKIKKPSDLCQKTESKRRDVYLNGKEIKNTKEFYAQIEKILGGESSFGHNSYGLWDMLSSGMGAYMTLHWKYSDISRKRLGEEFDKIEEILDCTRKLERRIGKTKEERFRYIME